VIALYAHTGLRPSELRLSKVKDLDLARGEICVSSPKGMSRWADGSEVSPIMPGCEVILGDYLERRSEVLGMAGVSYNDALFPFVERGQGGRLLVPGYVGEAQSANPACLWNTIPMEGLQADASSVL